MSKLNFTLEDLFQLPAAVIYEPNSYMPASRVCIDTRVIKPNSIFVAIKGQKFDGHKFVKIAIAKGANAVVINKNRLKDFYDIKKSIITVPDTVKALGSLANCWRKKLNLKVISITGSAGKTTVKDMLAVLLAEKYSVCKTSVNNNNHIGVPLTILSANSKHDVLLLEHGTNHFGEIEYTAKIAEPDFALITNIGSSHLEFLKNKDGVFKEKSVLFDSALQNNGTIFINTDDDLLRRSAKSGKQFFTYGFKRTPDIKAEITEYSAAGYLKVKIAYKNKKIETTMPYLGEASAKNFLAASAVALKLGLTKKQVISGANKLKATKQRLNVNRFNDFTLIDDTYNSNPDSLKSSITAVSNISERTRKIFILGDMFELGRDAIMLHKKAAKNIKRKSDEVYTIGRLMKHFSDVLKKTNPNCRHFGSRNALKTFLQKLNLTDSAALVKGSRGMAMEEFVKVLEDRN